eukprot:scaffold25494_cov146-Isochrysis_galbana.AAC.2
MCSHGVRNKGAKRDASQVDRPQAERVDEGAHVRCHLLDGETCATTRDGRHALCAVGAAKTAQTDANHAQSRVQVRH